MVDVCSQYPAAMQCTYFSGMHFPLIWLLLSAQSAVLYVAIWHIMFWTAAAAVLPESDISAATLDAPWNLPEQQDGTSETASPGLGCLPLSDFEYPEDRTAGLGSQAEARPLYER